ncbi:MAG TPA: sigma-54 dependent transcriptional regulator [Thermodesulfobacteriota bacterium]|nr:sigma-54 dependent transcriptional regulator [Thermodesulfobacteriota bacterium]
MPRCLVVEDEDAVRDFFARALETIPDLKVDVAPDGREALAICRRTRYDVVLTDIMMPEFSGLEFLRALKTEQPEVEVVLVTAYGTVERAIEAMKGGASEFLEKPVSVDLLKLVVGRCLERVALRQEIARLRGAVQAGEGLGRLIGRSPKMRAVFELIKTVAPVDSTVLILGETGTGKELVAREIHEASERRGKPFVAVSCGAIPETLLESELFGHDRGAFTGATRARPGKFEAADGGTIFLDEIGEIPPAVQHKLLRVLQEKEIERLGETRPVKVDVRVIAATHRDLEAMMREGRFREDLYYRLNVVPIRIPPLRERPEDIPLLAAHFLRRFAERFKKPVTGIAPAALQALLTYPWPGNVRELEHAIERAVIMSPGTELTDIPLGLPAARAGSGLLPGAAGPNGPAGVDLSLSFATVRRLALEQVESAYLRGLLTIHKGHLAAVAKAARINSRTLYEKMKEYGLRKEDFRGGA